MAYTDIDTDTPANPLDLVERMAALNEWSFERSADDEITLSLEGRWTNCHVSFQWMDEIEALHIACAFDLKVPDKRRNEVLRLLALINEQMWIGHFDLWSKEGVVMFRHALLLAGSEATDRQCEVLLESAVEAVERFFPAFQFVVWAGKPAREAMAAALFETAGEA
ncbi:MAG TPA: YbjN domain-containing protein [Xanthobacteraceae bacterium]|nr:YbjN domain-containing protein [Xanthobacteraceae bacterium]